MRHCLFWKLQTKTCSSRNLNSQLAQILRDVKHVSTSYMWSNPPLPLNHDLALLKNLGPKIFLLRSNDMICKWIWCCPPACLGQKSGQQKTSKKSHWLKAVRIYLCSVQNIWTLNTKLYMYTPVPVGIKHMSATQFNYQKVPHQVLNVLTILYYTHQCSTCKTSIHVYHCWIWWCPLSSKQNHIFPKCSSLGSIFKFLYKRNAPLLQHRRQRAWLMATRAKMSTSKQPWRWLLQVTPSNGTWWLMVVP